MVQYRYGMNSSGVIVTADSLAGTVIDDTFTCLGCEQPLIARVNGKVQRPHFGHKPRVECSGETYLHRLAKRVFQEVYETCLETGEPFTIAFSTPRICSKFQSLTGQYCDLGEDQHEYDLTQYYTDLRVETRDGQFIPDVSLHSQKRPDELIYIEIAVSHFLSEAKENSAKRIIEIPIRTEEDIEVIWAARLTPENASFRGFFPEVRAVPDAECQCTNARLFAFYVFESGKAYIDEGPLERLHSKVQNLGAKLAYVNIITHDRYGNAVDAFDRSRGYLFRSQIELAYKREVPIKNCYLCRYHGNHWNASSDKSIFCKTYKKPCQSNQAAECDRYRPIPVDEL